MYIVSNMTIWKLNNSYTFSCRNAKIISVLQASSSAQYQMYVFFSTVTVDSGCIELLAFIHCTLTYLSKHSVQCLSA